MFWRKLFGDCFSPSFHKVPSTEYGYSNEEEIPDKRWQNSTSIFFL